jgi:hypothetical protein
VATQKPGDAVAILSYDHKAGIQALVTTAPDLPSEPCAHSTRPLSSIKSSGTINFSAWH